MIRDMSPERCRELRDARPPDDDPKLQAAMKVWGGLTVREQENVFRSVYAMVIAYDRTRDAGHLEMIEDSLHTMVLMEQRPGFTEARRRKPVPPKPGEGIGMEELIKRLRS